jgi:hypothetical protein
MTAKAHHPSRQAWESAISAAEIHASIQLGMGSAAARDYAARTVGLFEDPEATPSSRVAPPAPPAIDPIVIAPAPMAKDVEPAPAPTRPPATLAEDVAPAAKPFARIEDDPAPPIAPLGRPSRASRQLSGHPWAWAMASLALAGVYCLAEAGYNTTLVEFVSSANTSADAFSHLESFGKALGAAGLSMALTRVLFQRWRAVAAFAVMAPLAYLAIDRSFDSYVEGLPHAAKLEGYYLGAYRSMTLSGQLTDPVLSSGDDIERRMRLLNLPLLVQGGVDAKGKVAAYVFSDGDTQSFDKEVAGLWDVYASVSRRIDPLYSYYAIESKKILEHKAFQDKYIAAFTARTGGIPPGLDKGQFNARVEQQYPALGIYRATVAIPAQPSIGMAALRMGDIPAGLDQPGFSAFINDDLAKAQKARRDRADDVEELPHSKALIASTFIPPLSMSLSLLSFAVNGAALLAGLILLPLAGRSGRAANWTSKAVRAGFTAVAIALLVSRPAALTGAPAAWQARAAESSALGWIWSKAIDAESSFLSAFSPALPRIHAAFIDDSHPEQVNRLRIAKAQPLDLADLDRKLDEFKAESDKPIDAPQVDPSFHADEKRLNDRDYYGESRPVGGNPYVKSKPGGT